MEILAEDRAMVVCVKPAGVSCEDGADPNTMPALLRAAWGAPGAPVYCVHRLDTATAGVMVYAKTRPAAAALSRQLQQGGLGKQYLCLCAGVPDPPQGQMADWLFKDGRSGKVYPVSRPRKGAKDALLDYRVLAQHPQGSAALCLVELHTGRTHQIRVQFASRRHPLHGDGKYGSRVKGALALWCAALTFVPPGQAEPRRFCALPPWHSPWPGLTDADFAALLRRALR